MNVASVTVRATTQWLTGGVTLGVSPLRMGATLAGLSERESRFSERAPAGPAPASGRRRRP